MMSALLLIVLLLTSTSQCQTDWSAIRCSDDELYPTPTYADDTDAVFSVCSELLIDASIADVYTALLDFQSYPEWNSFLVYVDLPDNITSTPDDLYVGLPMTFTTQGLIPAVNTTSNEIVTVLDPAPADINEDLTFAMGVWRDDDGANGTFLRAEHPSVLTDAGNGQTRYVSFETYYGAGAAIVLTLKENLQSQFEQQGQDLKAYVES